MSGWQVMPYTTERSRSNEEGGLFNDWPALTLEVLGLLLFLFWNLRQCCVIVMESPKLGYLQVKMMSWVSF